MLFHAHIIVGILFKYHNAKKHLTDLQTKLLIKLSNERKIITSMYLIKLP